MTRYTPARDGDEAPAQMPQVPPRLRFRKVEAVGSLLIALVVGLGAVGYIQPEQGSGLGMILRVALIFGLLTIGFRLIGKRELSQLSPFEVVTLLLVAEIVSPSLTAGDESIPGAVIGAATLLLLTFVNSVLSYRLDWYRKLQEAPPAVIICKGRFVESAMHKDRMRTDEIVSEMHKAGIEHLSQIKWGLLEPDGHMSFIRFDGSEVHVPQNALVS